MVGVQGGDPGGTISRAGGPQNVKDGLVYCPVDFGAWGLRGQAGGGGGRERGTRSGGKARRRRDHRGRSEVEQRGGVGGRFGFCRSRSRRLSL